MILCIRTDKPEAELALYENGSKVDELTWQAHRELSSTIHKKIEGLLQTQDKDWGDVTGVIFYKGPGSFTGLRIGASVAGTLTSTLKIPSVSIGGEDWISQGLNQIATDPENIVTIEYGSEPHITKPVK